MSASLTAQLRAVTHARTAAGNALYAAFVDRLRRLEVGAAAPQVGDRFPAFALPDAAGRYRRLDDLLAHGPLVLSFSRGGWCPYCAQELRAWGDMLPALAARGANFTAVTPEIGGRAALLARLLPARTGATLLCDVDSGVALAAGLAFRLSETLMDAYAATGMDLAALYGSRSGLLPVPATFLLDTDATVLFALADPDFRVRAEPAAVIAALDARATSAAAAVRRALPARC